MNNSSTINALSKEWLAAVKVYTVHGSFKNSEARDVVSAIIEEASDHVLGELFPGRNFTAETFDKNEHLFDEQVRQRILKYGISWEIPEAVLEGRVFRRDDAPGF